MLKAFSAAILAALAVPSSFAATVTWNGAGTDWNTTGNWNSAIPGLADTAVFGGTGNANLAVSLAAAGSAKNITFTGGAGAYVIGGAGTLALANAGVVSTDDLIAGPVAVNNAITLGSGAASNSYTFTSNSSSSGNTLSIGGNISAGITSGTMTLTLNGGNTGANTIGGAISNGSSVLALSKLNAGTWTLSGDNTYTGATTLYTGTVILDYTTNGGNKLGGGTSALALGGVNLQLQAGSGTETVASTTINNGGQTNISRLSGTRKIALGAITQNFTVGGGGSPTMINFQSGVATTTTTTANTTNASGSILLGGGYATVGTTPGSYDWAAVDASGNIVGYSTVNTTAGTTNGYYVLAAANNANTASNFILNDSFGTSGTGATSQTGVNTLKIATTSTAPQTLTLNTTLTLSPNGGILNSAAGDYTITGSTINLGASGSSLNQWGAGTLQIDSNIIGKTLIYWQKGGDGTLILTGNNVWKSTFAIQEGTVSVGSDANLGGQSGNVTVASSTSGGTTVTLASAAPATLISGSSFLGSTVSAVAGTSVTLFSGANQTIASDTSVPYAIASGIVLNGGTLEASASFTLSETGATVLKRAIAVNSRGGTIQVDPGVTLTAPGVVSGSGVFTKTGTGTLVLSGANTYTNTTQINEGIVQVASAETAGTSGPLGKQAANAAGTIVFGGGTLQYSAANAVDYSGRFSTAANQAVRIDTNSRSVTFATALSSVGGTLAKFGAGTLTLSAANTYTGATTVNAGTLALASAGSLASTSYTLNAGATLDVSAKASYSLATVATTFDVDSSAAGFLNAGLVTLTLGNSLTLNFTSASLASSYNLYDAGTISGNFTSVTLTGLLGDSLSRIGNTWSGANGGYNFSLDQDSGILSVAAIPEPSAWAVIVGALALGVAAIRRRRRD